MKSGRSSGAFTLIELITVIAIIVVLAALAAPVLKNFRKGDVMAGATRQMLDAVARGRQLAIAHHTTVYMVFAPDTLWQDPALSALNARPGLLPAVTNVLDKQLTGYAYVSLRSIADQPGRPTPRYLSAWHALPQGCYIPEWKFRHAFNESHEVINRVTGETFDVFGFSWGNAIPFPSTEAAYPPPGGGYVQLPYIAFNYQGQLVSGRDEFIPLTHGTIVYNRPAMEPSVQELPPGASTNSSFNLIHIDKLTGRARLQRQEVR